MMFIFQFAAVWLTVNAIALSEAALISAEAIIHSDHPNECFIEKTQSYLKPDEFQYLHGCGKVSCLSFSSEDKLYYQLQLCSSVQAGTSCRTIPGDRLSPYPGCCDRVECDFGG